MSAPACAADRSLAPRRGSLCRATGTISSLAGLVVLVSAALQLVVDTAAIGVALGPFGFGDSIPDRLGARLDDDPEDQNGRCFVRHGNHSLSSSSALSASSAETSRSLYLSIRRS